MYLIRTFLGIIFQIGPEENNEKPNEPSTSKTSGKKDDIDKKAKAIPPPKMTVRIEAREMMNITVLYET